MDHNPTSSFNLYHGTTKENIMKILESEEFIFEPRVDHWLGNGVYFFEDDIDKALWWSEMTVKKLKKNINEKGILFIEGYSIKRNKLFNLDSEVDRNQLANFLKNAQSTFNINLTSKDPEERMIEARAIVINLFVEYYKLSAVKYTFHKDNLKKHRFLSGLNLNNNETQFCIVDTETINFKDVRDITEEVI